MGILEGKIAVVTGGGQGLGKGTVHALVREGASVAIWGRTLEKIQAVADEVNQAGAVAYPVKCDVSDSAQVENAIAKTIERFGKLDILVVNHFASVPHAPITETPEENFLGFFNELFGKYCTKNDSFCALVYDVHILGDHLEAESYKVNDLTMVCARMDANEKKGFCWCTFGANTLSLRTVWGKYSKKQARILRCGLVSLVWSFPRGIHPGRSERSAGCTYIRVVGAI